MPAVRRGIAAGEAGLARLNAFRIVVAYDGTDFAGWQSQAPASEARTVQATLQEALGRLSGGRPVRVDGAGRTDAGVHAAGQVASFLLERDIAPDDLARALNGLLPQDVRVLSAASAPAGFHARRSARSKLYRYVLDTGPVQLPTRRRYAGHVPWTLDPAAVAAAAEIVKGRHDFAALASSGGSVKTTIRTVTRSEATFDGPTLTYEVAADGFLRKMVRSITGGLVAAGRGAASVEDLRRALAAGDRQAWPAPAEARGLTLVRVEY
jgi:tRNA pseudouridine38-40 synthase